MNSVEYFKDLSKEFRAVQNRIRNLIGPAHWPSDGVWKESVLRAVLRRYLPPSFTVGSGFIVMEDGVSTQIDILVCDDSAPVLFREGDFVIATPDCVRVAVEVKTKLIPSDLREALMKLNDISSLLRRRPVRPRPFLGLFCYEPTRTDATDILDILQATNGGEISNYEIQALCFGDSQYFRYWEFDPQSNSGQLYNRWHAYDLEQIAPGYFVHNLVEFLFPNAVDTSWYPADGKERRLLASKSRRDAPDTISGVQIQ
jgi:hypothetical protein